MLTRLKKTSYLLLDGEEDLDGVVTVTQVVLAHIHGFFLNDLLLASLCGAVRSKASLVRVTCIAPFLEKRLVSVGRSVFLLNDEVRSAILILRATNTSTLLHRLPRRTHHGLRLLLPVRAKLIRVLTYVLQQFTPAEVVLGPFGHVVVRLSLLQALKDDLVLSGDLHELALAGLAIETLFEGE